MSQHLCVDIGNYSVLAVVVNGRQVFEITKMRSLIYDCTHNGECRNGVHPVDSPLITIGTKSYKVGKQAKNYQGFLSAVEAGKSRADIILPILLVNTPQAFEGTVKMLVPARDELTERLITNGVVGTHCYQVTTNGLVRESTATFTRIDFVRESDAATLYAYQIGVIDLDDVVLTIDIGGGTVNTLVATYDDDLLNVIFRKSYDGSGGIALAQTIANTDIVKSYGRVFEISKLMDAISENKRYYGNRKDLSFEPVWESSVETWFDALLSRVLSATDKHLDEITQIVWCGGGTEIIRDKVQGSPGNIILDDPQLANIKGLIQNVKPQLRAVA